MESMVLESEIPSGVHLNGMWRFKEWPVREDLCLESEIYSEPHFGDIVGEIGRAHV